MKNKILGHKALNPNPIAAFCAATKRTLRACITITALSTAALAAGGPVQISNVGGATDSVGIVVNGRWTGQPSRAPATASDRYRGHAVIESQHNAYYWEITGSNFGTAVGSVWILDGSLRPLPNVTISYIKWSDTKIRIVPRGTDTDFRYENAAYIAVSLDKTAPNQCNARNDIRSLPVVGVIQSRGYG